MTDDGCFEFLGYPDAGPTLRLDHRVFAYAGKFVVATTGKAVLRTAEQPVPGDEYDRHVLAAVAFDADRTDATRLVVRYVTVRRDRRGEGLGPRLLDELLDRVRVDGGFRRARIAVNNPYAYEAAYRAGFRYTGERTGLAELVLERPVEAVSPADPERYEAGLDRFRDHDLDDEQRAFLDRHVTRGPPGDAGDRRAD